MPAYDAVVVLGSRPTSPPGWQLPSHIYASLDAAADLLKAGKAQYIVLSGKWTINFDVLGINQPFTEYAAMAEYLTQQHGVSGDNIVGEAESQDTISNFYYLKRQALAPLGLKRLLFVAAEGRLDRIVFLAGRILGPDYTVATQGVPAEPGEISPNEARTKRKQAAFLEPMADGDDHWLDGKFFADPFYDVVRSRVVERAALEPYKSRAKPPFNRS